MTNEEICRDYRMAKSRVKQIGILADLTGKPRKEIIRILQAGGCELPGNVVKKPKEPPKEPPKMEAEKEPGSAPICNTASDDDLLRAAYDEIHALKETIVRLTMERVGVI